MTSDLLFVYGSLKRGFSNHAELQGASFDGPARTAPRYRLLVIGRYPALAEPGERAIRGELYRVTPSLLARLDAFEGDDYTRAEVALSDGRHAMAYFLKGPALLSAADAGDAVVDDWVESPR